jgi:hypothetical protein
MQSMADSLLDRVTLGGFLIIWGLVMIIFHKKLNEYRASTIPDWLPRYIHGGAVGSLVFMVGAILFGIILILLGVGVLYAIF